MVEVLLNGNCLVNDKVYPTVGFGTFPFKDQVCFKAVMEAIQEGYRIIDTATFYDNFIPIGQAINEFNRTDFYLISKVWPNAHTKIGLLKDIQHTIKCLNTEYLDAYLLHWPNHNISIEETLSAMQELKSAGQRPMATFNRLLQS